MSGKIGLTDHQIRLQTKLSFMPAYHAKNAPKSSTETVQSIVTKTNVSIASAGLQQRANKNSNGFSV